MQIKKGVQTIVRNIDWEELEENERSAEKIITKSNCFGYTPWDSLRENGMTGGCFSYG